MALCILGLTFGVVCISGGCWRFRTICHHWP